MPANNTADKKKFPPIFWIAFALLVVLNLSVFIDYSKPLDKYQRFAGVAHNIELKPASVIKEIVRDGQALPECTVAAGGSLVWQSFASGVASYQFKPLVAATPGKSNENAICQAGDVVNINSLSEDNHNTQLILLSIDFNNPVKQ